MAVGGGGEAAAWGTPGALADTDVEMNFNQKGIDMKIGLDVAWLSIRCIVDRIVLCTGDRDFVRAMKLARREGVQVILATLGANPHPTLLEHAEARPRGRARVPEHLLPRRVTDWPPISRSFSAGYCDSEGAGVSGTA